MNFKNSSKITAFLQRPGRLPWLDVLSRLRPAFTLAPPRIPGWTDVLRAIRSVLAESVAILGLLVLIWSSTSIIIWQERVHELEEARGMTTALSKAFAETTARIVSEIDQTLLNLRGSYTPLGPDFDVQVWARSQIRDDQLRVQIAIMNKNGDVIKSTLARSNQAPINIADRPHFRYQLD